jgi:hypothetical protein
MCLTQARYGIAWGVVGAAMACFDEAARYAKERVMFDGPIGGKQIQQVRLADMLTEHHAGAAPRATARAPEGRGHDDAAAGVARQAGNVDMACEWRARRGAAGGNGILVEYHSMRHMANLESVYTYEGTHDIHSLILGQALFLDGRTVIDERWSPPEGGLMLGTTRYFRDGRAVDFEFSLVRADSAGVVLLPHPRGRASEHAFRLTTTTAGEWTFEAPQHDYPRRILYRLEGMQLEARIDAGADDAEPRRWFLQAVPCAS